MNYVKIGEFISAQRKALNLTQAKLAEKIYVSEKTISKWENGKGIPDTNSLPKLCEVLGVSITELLNGEKIVESNENKKSEQLLLDVTEELSIKNKTVWQCMWVIMTVSIIALLAGILVSAFLIPKGIWQLVAIVLVVVTFLIPCFYALKLEVSVGVYKCKNCGCEIVPTYSQALWAMHKGTTRFLKCPNCKKRTWCKKQIK